MAKNKQKKRGGSFAPPQPIHKKMNDSVFIPKRVVKISLSAIDSAPNTRCCFDEVAILALAHSIRKHGLLQPILVKKNGNGFSGKQRYTCVAGERRLRAHKMLGWEKIGCLVLPANFSSAQELSLVENLVRTDLNMFEYASLFSFLVRKNNLSNIEIAQELSTSEANVNNKLLLLEFTKDEQMFMLQSRFTERHALALLRIKDLLLRQKVMHLVAERQYTAKRTEEYVDVILSDLLPIRESLSDDDVELFGNGLNCSVALLHKKGVAAECERFEQEGEVQFLVRIPKR